MPARRARTRALRVGQVEDPLGAKPEVVPAPRAVRLELQVRGVAGEQRGVADRAVRRVLVGEPMLLREREKACALVGGGQKHRRSIRFRARGQRERRAPVRFGLHEPCIAACAFDQRRHPLPRSP